MACSGCGKARAAMKAKMAAQNLAQKQQSQLEHIQPPTSITPKTPRQIRIETRAARIAARNARIVARNAAILAQKSVDKPIAK